MIKRKELRETLSEYKIQGTAFLALAPHKVETTLTYMDLPDLEVCEYFENHNHILADPKNEQSFSKTVTSQDLADSFVQKTEGANPLDWEGISVG